MARVATSVGMLRGSHEPLYDVNPRTADSIEIFYADEVLAKPFGMRVGYFWWRCRPRWSQTAPRRALLLPAISRTAMLRARGSTLSECLVSVSYLGATESATSSRRNSSSNFMISRIRRSIRCCRMPPWREVSSATVLAMVDHFIRFFRVDLF